MPRSSDDSSGVPHCRQITAAQSPQVSGSATSRAHCGQYSTGAPDRESAGGFAFGSPCIKRANVAQDGDEVAPRPLAVGRVAVFPGGESSGRVQKAKEQIPGCARDDNPNGGRLCDKILLSNDSSLPENPCPIHRAPLTKSCNRNSIAGPRPAK